MRFGPLSCALMITVTIETGVNKVSIVKRAMEKCACAVCKNMFSIGLLYFIITVHYYALLWVMSLSPLSKQKPGLV